MPTYVYNKKRFVEFVEGLQEDDVILLSGELTQSNYSKKESVHKVTVAFGADVFKRSDSVGHFFRDPTWCFCVVKKEDLSETGQKIYEGIQNE